MSWWRLIGCYLFGVAVGVWATYETGTRSATAIVVCGTLQGVSVTERWGRVRYYTSGELFRMGAKDMEELLDVGKESGMLLRLQTPAWCGRRTGT